MRSLRFWFSILLSLVLLWFTFRGQDLNALWSALKNANYWLVAPAVALYFAGVWFRSVRWRTLLAPIKPLSARTLFPVVVIGYMANDVLPARMGELVRVYVLAQRDGVSRTRALGTVVVERLLDAVTMLALLGVGAYLVPLNGPVQRVGVVASALLLAGVLCLLLVAYAPETALRLAGPFLARAPRRASDLLLAVGTGFLEGLRVVRSARIVSTGLLLSAVAWLFEAGMYYVLALAFDLRVDLEIVLLTLAVANLATLVPAAPGYVGSFHFAALLVLSGLAGIDSELATGYVIVLHAALVLPVSLLGAYYWASHHLSLNRIRRDADMLSKGRSQVRATALD